MKTLSKLAVLAIAGTALFACGQANAAEAGRHGVGKARIQANCQTRVRRARRVRVRTARVIVPVVPYGFRYFSGYGWLRRSSVGDIIRARGLAAVLRSRAAINMQVARSRALDNRLKNARIRLAMKRLGAEARKAEYDRKRKIRDRYLVARRAATAKRLAARRAGEMGTQTASVSTHAQPVNATAGK